MKFLLRTNYTLPTDPDNRALIDAKSQISSDSMVGSSTKIGERATIIVIPNASHALLPEQPAAVVEAIVAWMGGLPRQP